MPGDLADRSATNVTKTIFANHRGHRVRGLGAEASMNRHSFEKGRQRTNALTVRKGNLLVGIAYGRWGYPPSDQLDAEAKDLARTVLAAQQP